MEIKKNQKCSIDNFNKFIYTICDINNTLVDEFGFEKNSVSNEPQYIFFIDEANQVSENTFARKSSGLIFLKECMGNDNPKTKESHNLWIIATNWLHEIDEAVYQPGRLANRLNFSWTLGKFKEYTAEAGIISDFPQHWIDCNSLSEEDNKWVSRFNVIFFEECFLGKGIDGRDVDNAISFWDMFINNEENMKILNEEKEEKIINEETGETEELIKKKGIQFGEFLQFFWQKHDSGELWDKDFDGKFDNPRKPELGKIVAEVGANIQKTVDVRLKELEKSSSNILEEMKLANNVFSDNFLKFKEEIAGLLTGIGENVKK